jgi:hypothetical protein
VQDELRMREREMRERIEGLLRRRMQGVQAPILGLGLAIIGCGCGGTEYGAQFPHDWGGDGAFYDAAGLGSDVPIYSAPEPLDAAVVDAAASDETSPADVDRDLASALDGAVDVAQTLDRG